MAGETDESRFPLEEGGDSMRDLLEASEERAQSLHAGQIVEGFIVHVEPEEVLVDIGLKSEGVVNGRELGSPEAVAQLQVGQTVLVYVLRAESNEGHPVLSLRRAEAERHWREAEEYLAAGATLEAPVLECNRGGLIVDLGLRAFVPISQVADLRRDEPRPAPSAEGEGAEGDATLARLQQLVGQRISVKIIELSRPRNRVIASQRAAVQELREQRKSALLSDLHVGDVRQGRVSSLAEFGAFVDLGGADGLVHISEVSWTRIAHPREVLQVGQIVDVAVLNVDQETKKIGLSIKQAQADPWTELVAHLVVGETREATITKLAKFGAFARLEGGVEGLIHISELADYHVMSASQVVQEGDSVQVKITGIDVVRKRLGLSMKQAQQDLQQQESDEALRAHAARAHDMLDEELQPSHSEFQKLAALRFDDGDTEG